MLPQYVIWLLFEKKDSKYLSEKISNLSRNYHFPFFLPHITVYGLIKLNLDEIQKYVKKSVFNVKQFSVYKKSINHSEEFWKSVFITLKNNNELTLINKKLTNNLKKISDYKFEPHISILYKDLSNSERKKLVNQIKIKNGFLINKIAILKYSNKIKNWDLVYKKFLKN